MQNCNRIQHKAKIKSKANERKNVSNFAQEAERIIKRRQKLTFHWEGKWLCSNGSKLKIHKTKNQTFHYGIFRASSCFGLLCRLFFFFCNWFGLLLIVRIGCSHIISCTEHRTSNLASLKCTWTELIIIHLPALAFGRQIVYCPAFAC